MIIVLKKKKFLEEIFLSLYEEKNSNFLEMINNFTRLDDDTIVEAILNINECLDLKYDKDKYLDSYINIFYN